MEVSFANAVPSFFIVTLIMYSMSTFVFIKSTVYLFYTNFT